MIRAPFRGWLFPYRSRRANKPGISCSANSSSFRPNRTASSEKSATCRGSPRKGRAPCSKTSCYRYRLLPLPCLFPRLVQNSWHPCPGYAGGTLIVAETPKQEIHSFSGAVVPGPSPLFFLPESPSEAQSDCIAVSISANTLPIGRAVSRRKPIGARFIHQGQNCRFSRGIRGL